MASRVVFSLRQMLVGIAITAIGCGAFAWWLGTTAGLDALRVLRQRITEADSLKVRPFGYSALLTDQVWSELKIFDLKRDITSAIRVRKGPFRTDGLHPDCLKMVQCELHVSGRRTQEFDLLGGEAVRYWHNGREYTVVLEDNEIEIILVGAIKASEGGNGKGAEEESGEKGERRERGGGEKGEKSNNLRQ